jgi:hypothetical protein
MSKSMGIGREIIEQVWERTNPNELKILRESPKLSFGEIETTYTLMYTVLQLSRDTNILKKKRDKK